MVEWEVYGEGGLKNRWEASMDPMYDDVRDGKIFGIDR